MVARQQLGEIFLGVTPKPIRDYIRTVLSEARHDYETLVIPCAGRFSVAEAAIQAGWAPSRIQTSDVSLFSSIIGTIASGRQVQELGVTFHDEFEVYSRYLEGPLAGGAILFCQKLAQLDDNKYFERVVVNELLRNPDCYIEQLQSNLEVLTGSLSGISYQLKDVRDHLREYTDNPSVCCYINPPSFSRGYQKMFDTGGRIKWRDPRIAEFDTKTGRAEIYKLTLDKAALSFIFRGRQMEPGMEPFAVFACEGKGRVDYVLCNRPHEARAIVKRRPETKITSANLPFLPDDYEIKLDSKIAFKEVTKGQALYYRDLFAHKLGVTKAERYFVALLDGYLMAVFGMFFSEVQRGVSGKVYETFGFCVPNKRYPRLNRLFMTAIVCEDARKIFQAHCHGALRDVDYFQTTCISTTPEQKTHRGSLELLSREIWTDGIRYKLVYGGPFKPWGFDKVLANWFDRMRNVQKQTNRDMGVDPRPNGKPGTSED